MMKMIRVMTLAMLCFSGQVWADISFDNVWVRLLPPSVKTTAAYMTITSTQDDKLLSATSTQAERVELHLSSMSNGVMSMNQVENIALEQNKPFELKPGSYHIMLIGLKKSLNEGDIYKLNLNFEKAGEIKIELPVKR
jgi:copper(I)-binding protein